MQNPIFNIVGSTASTSRIYYYVGSTLSTITVGSVPVPYGDAHYQLNSCPSGNCPLTNTNGCDSLTSDSYSLYYYVFYPATYANTTIKYGYSNCPLPVLIMFHSGGFSECSTAEQPDIVTMCQNMAARGFVVFDVSYRVGILEDKTPNPGVTDPVQQAMPKNQRKTAQQMLGIYRACQDARGAIRTIISRNGLTSAYKFNPDQIYIGGMSAGSLIALNAVYYQDQTHQIDPVFPGISAVLGSINPTGFYAVDPPISGNPADDYFPHVQGVFNMWGSMFMPNSNIGTERAFLNYATYKPPVISFAGNNDPIFDVNVQNIYFSKYATVPVTICGSSYNIDLGAESSCLVTTYIVPPIPPMGPNEYAVGSQRIYNIFNGAGFFAELYLDCQMGHGLDPDCVCRGSNGYILDNTQKPPACIPCVYQSDFGVAAILMKPPPMLT